MKAKPIGYEREKDGSGKYKEYIEKAIAELTKDGYRLPVMKTALKPSNSFQFRGPEHLWNAVQGYWERNKSEYEFRARVECRATYLGIIAILKEEELLKKIDNSKQLSKLEVYLSDRKVRHDALKVMSSLRKEIVTCLQQVDEKLVPQEEFERDVQEMINTFDTQKDKDRFAKIIDEMIKEEFIKLKNRQYKQKERYFEQMSKGIRMVADE